MPLSDYDKQFKKVIETAKSVTAIADTIEELQKKANAAQKKVKQTNDNDDKEVFSEYCSAINKATGELTKEVDVLATEGAKLAKIIKAILKEKT